MSAPEAPEIDLSEIRSRDQREALRLLRRNYGMGRQLFDVSDVDPRYHHSGFYSNEYQTPTYIVLDGDVIDASLSGRSLGFVPPELRMFTELRYFRASYDELDWIPPWLAKMPKLESLFLEGNLIAEIPSYVCKMKKLKELYLSSNHIKEIPSQLFSAPNLKTVLLDQNKIERIPPRVSDFRGSLLDLNYNPLRNLPESLLDLKQPVGIRATVQGVLVQGTIDGSGPEIEDPVRRYFSWTPQKVVDAIKADNERTVELLCVHPKFLRYADWIAQKVANLDNSAKQEFENAWKDVIGDFQRKWNTPILP